MIRVVAVLVLALVLGMFTAHWNWTAAGVTRDPVVTGGHR